MHNPGELITASRANRASIKDGIHSYEAPTDKMKLLPHDTEGAAKLHYDFIAMRTRFSDGFRFAAVETESWQKMCGAFLRQLDELASVAVNPTRHEEDRKDEYAEFLASAGTVGVLGVKAFLQGSSQMLPLMPEEKHKVMQNSYEVIHAWLGLYGTADQVFTDWFMDLQNQPASIDAVVPESHLAFCRVEGKVKINISQLQEDIASNKVEQHPNDAIPYIVNGDGHKAAKPILGCPFSSFGRHLFNAMNASALRSGLY